MLDFVLRLISIAVHAGAGGHDHAMPEAAGADVPALVAEAQDPTGKFTTATEVRPILNATKGNWVAVREWDGQDLVYVTHLMSWRCGLVQLRFAVNDGPLEVWEMPPCDETSPQPNAINTDDGLPYKAFELGSVQSVTVEITYDDLENDGVRFERADVLMP